MTSSPSVHLVLAVTLFIVALVPRPSEASLDSTRQNRPLFALESGCGLLGYPTASINKCGFCVGAETGLANDFGQDCFGKCSFYDGFDCHGHCYGGSYRDECTGRCVNSTSGSEVITLDRDVDGGANSNRDCRGMCVVEGSPESLLFQYKKDKCNMCRLESDSSSSPFVDCSGKCTPPGGPKSTLVCNKCISQSQVDTCAICPNTTCSCSR